MKNLITISIGILLFFFVGGINVFALERTSGINRYDTAVEISKQGWTEGANIVFLARGDEYPDALAGSVLAKEAGAPILLTKPTTIPEVTLEELRRLRPSKVVVLGGRGAISDLIIFEIKKINDEIIFDRIGGKDRFETAMLIANRVQNEYVDRGNGKSTLVLVNGMNFPDAVSIASYAAQNGIPILLTKKDSLPKVTDEYINDAIRRKLIVVGGIGAISESVFNEADNFFLTEKIRLDGKDRYETNYQVNSYFEQNFNKAFIATGETFPDALTGSVLAARLNAPVILTKSNELPNSIKTLLPKFKSYNILGGYGAVSKNIENTILSFEK